MTADEAITILKDHRDTFECDFGWNRSVIDALDMAIAVLSENEKD